MQRFAPIIGGAVGLAGGVSVVSMTAAYSESRNPLPKSFSLKESRYDLGTFAGRVAQQLTNMDPQTIFESDAKVLEAKKLMDDFAANPAAVTKNHTQEELWRARKLRDSAIHPDTQEIIPRPFRMAGYVPFNGPVCTAMMLPSSTPVMLFWNFVNQSQNALVNYSNRNASSPTSNETLAVSYVGAVTAALGVAYGVSTLIRRRYDPETAKKFLKFVALPSSMVASSANAYIMRRPEISHGIAVVTKDGQDAAPGLRSSAAASKAVSETVASRILLQLPTFFLPPVFLMIPPVAAVAAASLGGSIALNTFVTVVCFGLGLPAAVAVFPVIGEIKVDDLDEEVKKVVKAKNLDVVYYNKGL